MCVYVCTHVCDGEGRWEFFYVYLTINYVALMNVTTAKKKASLLLIICQEYVCVYNRFVDVFAHNDLQ